MACGMGIKKGRPIFGDPDWIALAATKRAPGQRAGAKRVGMAWWEVRGPGPEGKRCKECKHLARNRRYYKCGLVEITHGPGTDIRLKDQACRLFEQEKKHGT